MPTYNHSPFGELKGEVAEQIAYIRKGTKCTRKKPSTYKDANTLKQQAARKKMSELNKLSKVFSKCSLIGLRNTGQGQTEHNLFVQLNKNVVTVNEQMQVDMTVAQIIAAKGSLQKTNGTLSASKTGTDLTLSWNKGLNEANWSHKVVVAYRISEIAELITEILETKREDETATITMPMATTGVVDIWFYFKDPASRNVSDSEYKQIT